ncbi:MAG: UDP-N-acetylmuramate--L-alanine ligase [bacterium]|nr:UDP-N-acetylmuramate--L-alanine ligase [bacterium]
MKLSEAKHIYLIGIGGIGVSALARLFLMHGKKVSGSDLKQSQITDDLKKLGIDIYIGHDSNNINSDVDLVIYTEAVTGSSDGKIELEEAKSRKIESLSYSKALGAMMEGSFGIGVTGTNGKSTTTALLGLILEAAELDPSVVVGTQIMIDPKKTQFQANARLGKGKYFVAEADEYHRHMLDTNPDLIVLTNIAEDHLDYYKDIDDIKSAFLEYIKKLPKSGIVIYNADDPDSVHVGRSSKAHKYTYGVQHYADLQAIDVEIVNGKQSFRMLYHNEVIGQVQISMPGRYNIPNALAASLTALKLGVDFQVIARVLNGFSGIWRRFEVVGEVSGTKIISDYAHHPEAVAETIKAAEEFYPGKKILTVFQPHQKSRTQKLFSEFVDGLSNSKHLIIPEIFEVSGREQGEKISSKDLVAGLKKYKINAEYAADLKQTEEKIRERLKDYDVVLIMGAGDIDNVARNLVK